MKVSNEGILRMLHEVAEERPSLVRQRGMKNVVELECLHHHDPPDLFEEEEDVITPPIEINPLIFGVTTEHSIPLTTPERNAAAQVQDRDKLPPRGVVSGSNNRLSSFF